MLARLWRGLGPGRFGSGTAELLDDLLHANRVPYHGGVAQQAQTTGLVHDLVQIAIPEFCLVGEEGQGVPPLAAVLQLNDAPGVFHLGCTEECKSE